MLFPSWVLKIAVPGMALVQKFGADCARAINAVNASSSSEVSKASHATIFSELLEGDLPAYEKSVPRLIQEAHIVTSAGTETTAWCLSVITFHLLDKPCLLQKLRQELEEAIPDISVQAPLLTLEKLPYLSACIQEGLRLSYGVSMRLHRICPNKVMLFSDGTKTWEIPPGASIITNLVRE